MIARSFNRTTACLLCAGMVACGGGAPTDGQTSRSVFIASPAQPTFATRVDYATGTRPTRLVVTDLNRDGKPDVATANWGSSDVSVLINLGSGVMGTASPVSTRGWTSYSIVAGDIDGDGIPDLVTSNYLDLNVSPLHGVGDGTFTTLTKVSFPNAGHAVENVVLSDVNRDGFLDLVVAEASNRIGVALGANNGTFQTPTEYTAGSVDEWVAAGDLNGDLIPDVVIANGSGGQLTVMLGKSGGGFLAPVQYANATGAGTASVHVEILDVNGDGKLDLLDTDPRGAGVSVRLGNGDGTFAAATRFTTGLLPVSVALGDLNHDGTQDLVTNNLTDNTLTVLLNQGNGNYVAGPTLAVGSGPYEVRVADVNADSKPDIVVTHSKANTIGVLINTTP